MFVLLRENINLIRVWSCRFIRSHLTLSLSLNSPQLLKLSPIVLQRTRQHFTNPETIERTSVRYKCQRWWPDCLRNEGLLADPASLRGFHCWYLSHACYRHYPPRPRRICYANIRRRIKITTKCLIKRVGSSLMHLSKVQRDTGCKEFACHSICLTAYHA